MYTLNVNHGSLNEVILNRLVDTTNNAIDEYPRTMAVRVDLRLPSIPDLQNHFKVDTPSHKLKVDHAVISRFIDSLKSQIREDLKRKRNDGRRVHSCRVRYCWVRELGSKSEQHHYHLILFFNKDTYAHLGDLKSNSLDKNLITKIRKAWASALSGNYDECAGLVFVPKNPIYYLNRNNALSTEVHSDLIYRISYLAKDKTKPYGDGYRCFGCSQR